MNEKSFGPLDLPLLEERALRVKRFDLPPEKDEPLSLLNTELIVAWSDPHDMLSPKRVRDGDVAPLSAGTLDPHIQRLITLTRKLALLAKRCT